MVKSPIIYTTHILELPHEGIRAAFFVALNVARDEVIATAKADPWSESNRPFVSLVHVAPAYRRQGIARGLMLYIIEEAKKICINSLALYVHEDNVAAQSLYQSLGFNAFINEGENILLGLTIPIEIDAPSIFEENYEN